MQFVVSARASLAVNSGSVYMTGIDCQRQIVIILVNRRVTTQNVFLWSATVDYQIPSLRMASSTMPMLSESSLRTRYSCHLSSTSLHSALDTFAFGFISTSDLNSAVRRSG